MKTLTLLRHAKSSWKDQSLTDHQRPLNKRWKENLPYICDRAQQHDIHIDGILSSNSTRTTATTMWMVALMHDPDLVFLKDLYLADLDTLLHIIRSADQHSTSPRDHLMIVWHNPWLTNLCQHLGFDIPNLPTCGLVEFQCNIDMRLEFDSSSTTYLQHIFPKELSH